ncbi:unnamed protein product, partial [Rotaria sp. Silwood1]
MKVAVGRSVTAHDFI